MIWKTLQSNLQQQVSDRKVETGEGEHCVKTISACKIQGGPKKGRSQKTKIGHGGGFLKKKSMTNKIKKFLYTL